MTPYQVLSIVMLWAAGFCIGRLDKEWAIVFLLAAGVFALMEVARALVKISEKE